MKTRVLALLGTQFVVSVWAICLDADGRVLLFYHTHDRAHPWGLPSGRVEGRESPEEAVTRELREEVGVVAEAGPLLAAFNDGGLAIRLAFLCTLRSHEFRPSVEVSGWKYVAAPELPESVRPLQRRAIAAALGGRTSG